MKNDLPPEYTIYNIVQELLLITFAVSGSVMLVDVAEEQGIAWDNIGLAHVLSRDVIIMRDKALLELGRGCLLSAIKTLKKNYRIETGARADINDFHYLNNCISKVRLAVLFQDSEKASLQRTGLGLPKNLLEQFNSRFQREYIEQYFLENSVSCFMPQITRQSIWHPFRNWLIQETFLHLSVIKDEFTDAQKVFDALIHSTEAPIGRNKHPGTSRTWFTGGTSNYSTTIEQASSKIPTRGFFEQPFLEGGMPKDANFVPGDSILRVYIAPDRIDIDVSGTQGPIDLEIIKSTPPNETMPFVTVRKGQIGLQALFGGIGLAKAGRFTSELEASAQVTAPQAVLGLRFLPNRDSCQIEWITERPNRLISKFISPYSAPVLASILRMLEHFQHPDFILTPKELEELESATLLVPDLEDSPYEQFIHRIGRDLYDAITHDSRGMVELWRMRALAASRNQPLHLNIIFPPDAVELASLPWELLQTEDSPLPMLLPSQMGVLLSRRLDFSVPLPPWEPRGNRPLRIVSLVPQVKRSFHEPSGIGDELASLWAELEQQGMAQVTQISPFTREDLARLTKLEPKPDIVQFTGHGWYAQGRGVLFCDPTEEDRKQHRSSDLIDANQMAMALLGVRMAILTACRGSYTGPERAHGLLNGVVPTLSSAGVPLVVGMQLGVRVSDALRACHAIYSALAAGKSVQTAVGLARSELFIAEKDVASWYVPTLYICADEIGSLFL